MARDRTSHVPQRWEWIYGENGELVATDPGARVNRMYTASQLTQMNPRLLDGQMIQEKDTGALKVGDGTNVWRDLPYFVGAIAQISDEQLSAALDEKDLLDKPTADATYVRWWVPSTVVASGELRISPEGQVVQSTSARTTGTTWDTTELAQWSPLSATQASASGAAAGMALVFGG